MKFFELLKLLPPNTQLHITDITFKETVRIMVGSVPEKVYNHEIVALEPICSREDEYCHPDIAITILFGGES